MTPFKRFFPSILATLAIIVLSLAPMPEMPQLGQVPLWDKCVHFVMYGGTCAVIWIEYLRHHQSLNKQKLILWAWLAPTVMGGIIEIVQEQCTTNRSGEWLDFAADAVGVLIGAVIGLVTYGIKRSYRSK